jgi:hypothetical protein
MADNELKLISEAKNRAKSVLSGLVESEEEDEIFYSFNTSADEDLSQAVDFEKNLGIYNPTSDLGQILSILKQKRSSFLPYDFVAAITSPSFQEGLSPFSLESEISDVFSFKEPYSNTFMRLIGLPSHDCDELRNSQVVSRIIDEDILWDTYLDKRYQYDVEKTRYKECEDLVQSPIMGKAIDCYYPFIIPVQDGRISSCINESEKIVFPPFSQRFKRVLNGKDVRPTLLEAIIRIRLDRFSGTTNKVTSGTTDTLESFAAEDVDSDRYGLLESLFILRLNAAIKGLKTKTGILVENIYIKMDILRPNRSATAETSTNQSGEQDLLDATEGGVSADISDETIDSINQQIESLGANQTFDKRLIDEYNNEIAVEEAILNILGKKEEFAIDYEKNTIRNTSINDAYLISPALSIIQIRLNSLKKQLKELEKKTKLKSEFPPASDSDAPAEGLKNSKSKIEIPKECAPDFELLKTIYGADVGIGAIDIAVFTLALFSIQEKYLLGLLTQAQFDNMKNGEFKGLIPPFLEKESMENSIIELSKYLKEGYYYFFESDENP